MSRAVEVTIIEHDDSVSVLYNDVWQLTLWCDEAHVGFVHDMLLKWATNISKGKVTLSPVWQMILGGIVHEYSYDPGESKTKDEE